MAHSGTANDCRCNDGADGVLWPDAFYRHVDMELADMRQDEVVQTLREVIAEAENFTTWTVSTPHLVELVKRAVEAEREACAKIAYGQLLNTNALLTAPMQSSAAYQIGVSIRARGQA